MIKLILILFTLFISFNVTAEEPSVIDYAACGIILSAMQNPLLNHMAITIAISDITADELDAAIKVEIKLIDEIGKNQWLIRAVHSCKVLGYIMAEDVTIES